MKKLTAGMFAGILTIVTVNAADAAITSKKYVDDLVGANTAEINTLKTTVGTHTTDIADLKASVESLSGDGTGSVADQIAEALGDLGDTTVKVELDKKQDESTAAYSMGTANGGWKALEDAELGALQSGITSADVTQITTNKNNIAKIGDLTTLKEGETVLGLIDEAKTAATEGVDDKLGEGFDKDNTVADALAEKQNLLGATNVVVSTEEGKSKGNVVSAVTANNGTVTIERMQVIPEVTTTGEAGTYVLTATVTEGGVTNYMWESIERTVAAPAGE